MTRYRITGGGVRQTPSGRWQARFIAPDGTRRSAGTFLTDDQALAAVRDRAADVDKCNWKAPVRAGVSILRMSSALTACGTRRGMSSLTLSKILWSLSESVGTTWMLWNLKH
jgi:hypothetical protein